MRLGAGPAGATLVAAYRGTSHPCSQGRTCGLHHFVSTSPWPTAPREEELVRQADALVGGPDAVLVVDDTPLIKQGRHSVGVARQYCSQVGKTANCQVLVSLTMARRAVPVCVGLRLFLPQSWVADADRRRRARGWCRLVGWKLVGGVIS